MIDIDSKIQTERSNVPDYSIILLFLLSVKKNFIASESESRSSNISLNL